MAMIAILDDDDERLRRMRAALLRHGLESVEHTSSGEMIGWLERGLADADLLSLDHDLGPSRTGIDPGTGRDVVEWLVAQPIMRPIIIHTTNPLGRQAMLADLEEHGWNACGGKGRRPAARGSGATNVTARVVIPVAEYAWIDGAWIEAVVETLQQRGAGGR